VRLIIARCQPFCSKHACKQGPCQPAMTLTIAVCLCCSPSCLRAAATRALCASAANFTTSPIVPNGTLHDQQPCLLFSSHHTDIQRESVKPCGRAVEDSMTRPHEAVCDAGLHGGVVKSAAACWAL
jgi:hypothetical protein